MQGDREAKTEPIQLSRLVEMRNPDQVLSEVEAIVSMMFSEFDFETLNRAFADVVRLFHGEYPGYRECTTEYHDLKHTTDTFLAMARLIHGAVITGTLLTQKQVVLGLICALMHDTGFIQTRDDGSGTGAKYIDVDTKRSIEFMARYIAENGYPEEDFNAFASILTCTDLGAKIDKIPFPSPETELLGKLLGTADLVGQMADRTYLEKLLFLFYEFREGGVMGYANELHLLQKTRDFYKMTRKRLAGDFSGVHEYVRHHFRVRWKLDRDLYMEALERNMAYLNFILKHHRKDYRKHLRRDGLVDRLIRQKGQS
jgi:hypothetical protein